MNETKKVIRQLDKAGNVIKEWDPDRYSTRDIAKELGDEHGQSNIVKALKGKRPTAFGFKFEYADKVFTNDFLFNSGARPSKEEKARVEAWIRSPNVVDERGVEWEDLPWEEDYKDVDFKALNERVRSLMFINPATGKVRTVENFDEHCLDDLLNYKQLSIKVGTGINRWERWLNKEIDPVIIMTVRYYQIRYGQDSPDFWTPETLAWTLYVGHNIYVHNYTWLEFSVSRAFFRAVRDGNTFTDNFYARAINAQWYTGAKEDDPHWSAERVAKNDPWQFECKDYIIDDINGPRPELLRQYMNTGGYLERPVYTNGQTDSLGMFGEAIYGVN